jgi:hypothetical protein
MNSPPSPQFMALRASQKGGAGFLKVPHFWGLAPAALKKSACGIEEKGADKDCIPSQFILQFSNARFCLGLVINSD